MLLKATQKVAKGVHTHAHTAVMVDAKVAVTTHVRTPAKVAAKVDVKEDAKVDVAIPVVIHVAVNAAAVVATLADIVVSALQAFSDTWLKSEVYASRGSMAWQRTSRSLSPRTASLHASIVTSSVKTRRNVCLGRLQNLP